MHSCSIDHIHTRATAHHGMAACLDRETVLEDNLLMQSQGFSYKLLLKVL